MPLLKLVKKSCQIDKQMWKGDATVCKCRQEAEQKDDKTVQQFTWVRGAKLRPEVDKRGSWGMVEGEQFTCVRVEKLRQERILRDGGGRAEVSGWRKRQSKGWRANLPCEVIMVSGVCHIPGDWQETWAPDLRKRCPPWSLVSTN